MSVVLRGEGAAEALNRLAREQLATLFGHDDCGPS